MAWRPGPLPPNTYQWGAVVPVGVTGGFYFAGFKGDHAVLFRGGRVLLAHEVAWYDNSLVLPPRLGASQSGLEAAEFDVPADG